MPAVSAAQDTRLLQLADSAFPSGGFAHSAGLEALMQLGVLRTEEAVVIRLREMLWHTGHSVLPFVNEAFAFDAAVADAKNEVFLSNHVAARASRAQGGAFLIAADATFAAHAGVARVKAELPQAHFAVAFGAVFREVGLGLDEARQTFLFSSVRSALSALVRLGVVGPLRAQGLLWQLHGLLETILASTVHLRADDAVATSAWLDLAQMAHDRLYSRLFQS